MENLIFGYTWEEIQQLQQGTFKRKYITSESKPIPLSKEEFDLFNNVGLQGLENMGYFGLIDRIQRLNLIDKCADNIQTEDFALE